MIWLRFAVRALRRRVVTTMLLWLVLGLGTGIPAAVLAAAVVVATPAGPDQATVFRVYGVTPSSAELNLSPPDFHDIRAAATRIESLAAVSPFAPQLTLTGRGDPRLVVARRVSSGFFQTLGVPILAGREFLASEETPPARPVILGEPFWRDVLGSRSDAVGQLLLLNGAPYTVIGVVSGHDPVLGAADVWLPVQFPSREIRGLRLLTVIGRMAPGRPPADGAGELAALAASLRAQHPTTHAHADVRVVPLAEAIAGPLEEPTRVMTVCALLLWVLTTLVAAGYAIAVALQTWRPAAIARALGGSPLRVWISAAAPHTVLVTMALPLTVAAAAWTITVTDAAGLLALPRPASAMLAALIGTGLLLFILVTMIGASAFVPSPARPDAMRGAGRSVGRGQRAVVATEAACAVVLLVVATTLIWGVVAVGRRDPGFTAANRLYARLSLPNAGGTPPADRWRVLTAAAAVLPGVSAVALTTELPHTGQDNPAPFTVDSLEGRRSVAGVRAVTAAYPSVAGLRLLKGRWLDEADDERRPRVALVNRRLAVELFGTDAVVGRTVAVDVTQPPMTADIVGVVSDIRHASLWGDVAPEAYFSLMQVALPSTTMVIESTLAPSVMQPALHAAVRSREPDMAVPMLVRWSDAVQARIAPYERRASFAGVLALTAILLTAASLYALVAQIVETRRQEFAVRIALGCPPHQAQRVLLAHSTTLALLGAIPGSIVAMPPARLLASTLGEWATSVAVASASAAVVLLGAVACAAAWKPARDAARIDPASTLRP
jgi:predicted permease